MSRDETTAEFVVGMVFGGIMGALLCGLAMHASYKETSLYQSFKQLKKTNSRLILELESAATAKNASTQIYGLKQANAGYEREAKLWHKRYTDLKRKMENQPWKLNGVESETK